MANTSQVSVYSRFELTLAGSKDGNPFVDVEFGAVFKNQIREIRVTGFHDGDGIYKVRFMPDEPGRWQYVTFSNIPGLDKKNGEFTCTPALSGKHGPVRVADQFHFSYADGTHYTPIGTTCYAWTHQGDALELQTLETLHEASFNKIRMCVFPKHYRYNANEPPRYPFEQIGRAHV